MNGMELYGDFALRLLVAGLMGVAIGLEREYRAKEAGYRTHFLVALGSALMMIVSQYGFTEVLKATWSAWTRAVLQLRWSAVSVLLVRAPSSCKSRLCVD